MVRTVCYCKELSRFLSEHMQPIGTNEESVRQYDFTI